MNILEEFNGEGVYTRYAVDEKPDDSNFTMHVHEQCEIYCFVSGDAEYLVEGARYPLKAGSVLIMRPAESHRVKILGGGKYERYAVNFSPSFTERLDSRRILMSPFYERPLGRGNLYPAAELGGEIPRWFDEMCRGGGGYERQLVISTRLFLILEMIYKAYLNRGAAEYAPPTELSEQIVTYVNAHLFECLAIPALAERFFLSASQFNRGIPPCDGSVAVGIHYNKAPDRRKGENTLRRTRGNCCGKLRIQRLFSILSRVCEAIRIPAKE